MKFSVKCRSKKVSPGSTKCKRILFEYKSGHKVPFLGHPFTIEDTLYKNCHLGGRERTSADQQQKSLTCNLQKYPVNCEQTAKTRITKKQGCEAIFVIKKLFVYEGIEVEKDGNKPNNFTNREVALQKVKSGDYNATCWFCFQITKPEFHNHNFGEATQRCHTIHPLLVERIKELVQDGVRKAENIKNILEEYVKSDILKDSLVTPTSSNASFFPSIKAVRNAVCRAVQSEKYHKIDLEVLAERLEQWNDGHIYYRPYVASPQHNREIISTDSDDVDDYLETFLLVHQTQWQKEMLKSYGDVCILDAVYKTIKYGIPLFFLVVKTNLGYALAATFVVQFETKSSLLEALQLIRNWNPEWVPSYFLSGASRAEMSAAEKAFPESEHFVSDFHREQSWLHWLHKNGNVAVGMAEELFGNWQKLTTSNTRGTFETMGNQMEVSPAWVESRRAQNYFSEVWMPMLEKWAHFNRPFDLRCCINLNNGLETLSKFLQHSSLVHHVNKNISAFLGIVVESYLPEQIRGYVLGNIGPSDYEKQEEISPDWLRNRPNAFVRHVQTRWSSASNEFHHIVQDNPEQLSFVVKSSCEDFPEEAWCSVPSYRVELFKPSCTCYDFNKWFYPCKHMCAVLIFVPSVSVECLPSGYLNSPYLIIHQNILQEFPTEVNNDSKSIAADSTCEQRDHSYQQQKQLIATSGGNPFLTSKAAECREILREMSNLTYLVNNPLVLEKVIQGLQPLLRDLNGGEVVLPDFNLLSNDCLQSNKRDFEQSQDTLVSKRTKVIL